MPTPMTKDPKQLLDEAIDAAFAHDKSDRTSAAPMKPPRVAWLPAAMRRLGFAGLMVAASTAFSVVAAFVTVALRRRAHHASAPRTRLLFGKPARHFGYGRYHLGRYGTAFIAYTYKRPAVRYRVPPITYKLPPIHVKLPAVHR